VIEVVADADEQRPRTTQKPVQQSQKGCLHPVDIRRNCGRHQADLGPDLGRRRLNQ
jgi:hypothetical protein